MKVVGIIPAMYGSTCLLVKLLKDICGHPLLWWVYERTRSIDRLDETYIATDDEQIAHACKEYGLPFVMTASTNKTVANHLQEISQSIAADFYVQINGDEPLIDTAVVEAVIPVYVPQDKEFGTSIIVPITDPAQVVDASNIKMVFDQNLNALYMSRAPIPYPFKALDFTYYKHIGIIGYNKKMLDFYRDSVPGHFERIEGIDTLRFLDYGKQLKLICVENCHSLSVDTQKDLDIVIQQIKEQKNDAE